jgi:hypothetical protein
MITTCTYPTWVNRVPLVLNLCIFPPSHLYNIAFAVSKKINYFICLPTNRPSLVQKMFMEFNRGRNGTKLKKTVAHRNDHDRK